MVDITEQTVKNILEDYNKFTKEEYEIIDTYMNKNKAKYDIRKFELLAQTEPKYFQANILISKYGDLALKHKEMILSTTMEHMNIHKEILLQCLSIMQSLVNNPNVLDTLVNFLSQEWYGGQDFKQFLSNIINNELENINELYVQQVTITNKPLICFLPELYDSGSMDIDTNEISDFYNTLSNKYVLEP